MAAAFYPDTSVSVILTCDVIDAPADDSGLEGKYIHVSISGIQAVLARRWSNDSPTSGCYFNVDPEPGSVYYLG